MVDLREQRISSNKIITMRATDIVADYYIVTSMSLYRYIGKIDHYL